MNVQERLKNWWINFRLRNFGIDYDWGRHPSEKNKADGINFVFRNWLPARFEYNGVNIRHHHPTAMYVDNWFESGPSTTYPLFYFIQYRVDLARANKDLWFMLKRFVRLSDDQIARLKDQADRFRKYGIRPVVD